MVHDKWTNKFKLSSLIYFQWFEVVDLMGPQISHIKKYKSKKEINKPNRKINK